MNVANITTEVEPPLTYKASTSTLLFSELKKFWISLLIYPIMRLCFAWYKGHKTKLSI